MDAAVHQVMMDYGNQVTNSEWHVWWPGAGDPFYLHNQAPVDQRVSYYGFNGVPHVRIDGTEINGTYAAATHTRRMVHVGYSRGYQTNGTSIFRARG